MRVAQFSSVMQSCPTLCDPMDTRSPCPSPTPWAYSNSCPSSQWCHPAISSSVVPFSCFQSFPASGSFPVSQFFTSVRVASDPPRSQGMTRDTEHRGIMLSILWILVLLWILSIHLACFHFCIPLGSKDLITLNFKNLLFTVQGWRSWWEAALLCAHSEPFEFRKQGSEAADKTQTLILLETQPRLEQVRVTTIQMQRSPVPGSQTHRRSTSHSTQITSAIAFMFFLKWLYRFLGLPWRLSCNKSACSAGDMGSIPESGRSPGEGNGNPLQYSCLGNPWTEEPSGL